MAELEPVSPSPPPESGSMTPLTADSLTPRVLSEKLRAQRTLVAREILSTEQTYVEMLQTLVDVYFEPTKKLFDEKTHAQLFSNILTVRDVNLRFLADLEKRIADWNEDASTIGDIFLTYAPFFRMYTQYVNNYERTGSLTTELKAHKRFEKFRAYEQQARKHPRCHGQRLVQFLIIPIQRIPRYKLLLRELRKNTHSSHPDDKLLSKALVEVDKVAQQINEAVRASENRKTVLEIQSKFQDAQFLTPTRLFIVSGSLNKTSPQERAQSFKFFLFNDLLVWARHRKNNQKYRIEFSLPIDELFFVETVPESLMPNSIKIIYDQQSFLLSANSIVDRDAWLVNFQKCIRQRARTIKGQNAMLHGSGIRRASFVMAPLFKPKNQADKCLLCAKSFGLLRQRHNCRCCGEVVCADCSPHRLPVASLGTKVRVCSPCQEQVSRDERLQEQQLAQIETFLKSRSLNKRHDTSQDLLSPTRSRDRSGSDLSIPEALSDDHKITIEASEHSEDSCGNPTNAPQDRSASPSLVESIQRFNVLTSSGRASPDDADSGLSLRLPKRSGTASSSVSPAPSDHSAPGLEYPPVSARLQHSRTLRPDEIKAILLSGFEPEDDAADISLLLSDVDLEQQCRKLGIPLPMDRDVSISEHVVRPLARPPIIVNPKRASLDSDDVSQLLPPDSPPPPPPS